MACCVSSAQGLAPDLLPQGSVRRSLHLFEDGLFVRIVLFHRVQKRALRLVGGGIAEVFAGRPPIPELPPTKPFFSS